MTTLANSPLSSSAAAGLVAELKSYASSKLPEAMVPSRIVVVDGLPKLPNGKVDRGRLPALMGAESSVRPYLPPSTPVERRIVEIWETLLSESRIGLTDSFFERGGDSLSIAQMVAQVREVFDVPLSLRQVLKAPTPAAIAAMVSGSSAEVQMQTRSITPDELYAEAILPDDVVPAADALPPRESGYTKVLVTGGTGYTGAYILRALFERSVADAYVLARASNNDEASERVRESMIQYGLWKPVYAKRIIGITGDVGRPFLGLDRQDYLHLQREAQLIIHNGALSSYAMPYRQLKPVNVLGTIEVLRLAATVQIKPVHYVSSLSVFPGLPGRHEFFEGPLGDPHGVVGGYRQSKWVADRLVTEARARGLPTQIYRPGQITGATDTGACSTDTYLNAGIKGCIQLGLALPFDVMLEMCPVDYCAASIVKVALRGPSDKTHFHLIGPRPVRWSALLNMVRAYGYRLDDTAYSTWYAHLAEAVQSPKGNALGKFFALFGEENPSGDAGDEGSVPIYRDDNLREVLGSDHEPSPPCDQALVDKYLGYFEQSGFLPPPPSRARSRPGATSTQTSPETER